MRFSSAWQTGLHDLTQVGLAPWLSHPGSFMQGLKKRGVTSPEVLVLDQAWQRPFLEESQALNILGRQFAFIREVLIQSEKQIWMYARTVIPRTTLTGSARRLLYLKNRAIGSILFQDPRTERSEFEFVLASEHSLWHQKMKQYLPSLSETISGRRSTFWIQGKPLLLQEFFMPSLGHLS